jgi:hypothetical protein
LGFNSKKNKSDPFFKSLLPRLDEAMNGATGARLCAIRDPSLIDAATRSAASPEELAVDLRRSA